MTDKQPIKIPFTVWLSIVRLRESGVVNMYDHKRVLSVLYSVNEIKAYNWIKDNKELYLQGTFHGFDFVVDPRDNKEYIDYLFSQKEGITQEKGE